MRTLGRLFPPMILVTALLLTGCAGSEHEPSDPAQIEAASIQPKAIVPQIVQDHPDPSSLPAETLLTEDDVTAYGEENCFTVEEIPDDVFARMQGKTFKSNCTVPREDLRYIRVLHKNIDGEILTGELVMHESVADDICEIFHELYTANYPIERMRLADDYDADDRTSMNADNTSAFNFRLVEGTDRLSNHARGLAIDINPFFNPYCIPSTGYVSPWAAEEYADRSKDFPYKISEGDLLYDLFTERGFKWGGHWNSPKDYQHFEKGMSTY